MALDLRLQHKMAPQLVMTPQLQQAIGLLQLSHLEMAAALRQEIADNPVFDDESASQGLGSDHGTAPTPEREQAHGPSDLPLESWAGLPGDPRSRAHAGHGTSDNALDALPANPASLTEHLHWQLKMAHVAPALVPIAEALIEEVGVNGYLAEHGANNVQQALGASPAQVLAALAVIQEFEPQGVAARDLKECLLIQARCQEPPSPLVLRIVGHHLGDIERHSVRELARTLRVDPEEVSAAIGLIRTLEPLPGRAFVTASPHYIVPDIYVSRQAGSSVTAGAPGTKDEAAAAAESNEPSEWQISLNEDSLPQLLIAKQYQSAATAHYDQAAKVYLQEKLRSAHWLMRSVAMRARTMYKVMQSILQFQRAFFDEGPSALKPLTLREVAADVGMHESTISRVTSNKFVHTPQGLFELKYFFNSSICGGRGKAVGSASVRSHIERLIAQENKHAPLSDQKIVEFLQAKDISIARRTVAKYRKMLRKDSSCARKRSM